MKFFFRIDILWLASVGIILIACAWGTLAKNIPRSDVELVGFAKNGNHVLLSDSTNHVAIWELNKDRYRWVSLPSQMGAGAPSTADDSFFALSNPNWSNIDHSKSRLHHFDGKSIRELCEWPNDGRTDKIFAVGPSYLCGFRLMHGFDVESERYTICEFYKTDATSIHFDHQLLLDSEHSIACVCPVSSTKILICRRPKNGGLSQIILYDVLERRLMAMGNADFKGAAITMQCTTDGKFVIAYDGAKILLIQTATCTTKVNCDVDKNVGLLNVSISDDHKLAVVASSRLCLFDLTTEEQVILDELNSSQIESTKPLVKDPKGDLAEVGARLGLCAAGVAFVPNTNQFIVWMHSGEVQYWDAERRIKMKTTKMKFE
jgi:hypothetical protein